MPRLYSWKVISFLTLIFILDLSVTPGLGLNGARPVFLYLVVLYSAFEWNLFKTMRIAFVVGLMRDLAGTQPLGVETLALSGTSFFAGYLIQKIDRNSFVMRAGASVAFVFAVSFLAIILSALLGGPAISGHALSTALLTGFWTGVFAPVFFIVSHRWFEGRLSSLKQYELFR